MFRIWNVACVSKFGVATLETFCLSTDLAFRIWKRCACQRMWCSEFGNAAFLSEFGVARLETLCMSGNIMPVGGFGVQNLGTLRLSADLVLSIWKRCYTSQQIWSSKSENAVHVSDFGVIVWPMVQVPILVSANVRLVSETHT